MNHTLKTLATAFIATAYFASFNLQAEMFWSDNSLSYLKNLSEFEVNTNEDVDVFTIEHASGHNWGDLFFFADRLNFKADKNNPKTNETYSEFSPRLSLSYATGNKLEFGIVSDLFIATTWEHDTYENEFFSQSFDNYLVGFGANLTVPTFSYFNVNVYQANNELTDNDTQLTVVWGLPFSMGSADFMFDGFIDWSSAEDTHAADFHFNPQLRLDVGKYFGVPKKFEAGFEYSYWVNKYGLTFPDTESVFSAMVKVHL